MAYIIRSIRCTTVIQPLSTSFGIVSSSSSSSSSTQTIDLFTHGHQCQCQQHRCISSREWREKHNRFRSRLDDLPDWSYTDGRGYGPPSVAQKKRYLRDQEFAKTVIRRYKELEESKKLTPE